MKTLYLSQNPAQIEAQLKGQRLTLAQADPLRDDISTDEITPVAILSHYDATLGDFAHTGLRCAGQSPIARGQLRAARFEVLVAGQRYGKGSSREHSPTADLLEALRKRRNERESTPAWLKDEVSAATDSHQVVAEDTVISGATVEFDATLSFTEPFDMSVSEEVPTVAPSESKNDSKQIGKNGRPAMPSWDDIVFGTRSDDDPA